MRITKEHLTFYRQKKVASLWGVKDHNISIHVLINIQTNYDPFDMRKKGTKRHNSIHLMKLMYENYKHGRKTKEDFIHGLYVNKFLRKYIHKFE